MSAKQVTVDSDDEYETEEFLVYVDLDAKLLDNQLLQSNTKIKLLGFDTDRPVMQLNNKIFRGSYEFAMGTHMFFNESKKPGGLEDPIFQEMPEKLYEYYGKTNKVLKMKRIFVEEKETDRDEALAEGEVENLEHLRISKTYEQALNQFLKAGESAPRQIIESIGDQDEEGDEDNSKADEQDGDDTEMIEDASGQVVKGENGASDEEMEQEEDPDYVPRGDR